jgi:hypothetical protein
MSDAVHLDLRKPVNFLVPMVKFSVVLFDENLLIFRASFNINFVSTDYVAKSWMHFSISLLFITFCNVYV